MSYKQMQLPSGFRQLETQVAGHTFEPTNASAIGLLQNIETGCVLKPLGKPDCGERELNFYESLTTATGVKGSLLAEARKFVPKFYQRLNLVVNCREYTFIKLEDLSHGMLKPCIMDIKIGKRTWDPLASPQKRSVEEQKYFRCKQTLGLCVPGFQVYIPSKTIGKSSPTQTVLIRHGKEYGKSLDAFGFRRTIALFLNADADLAPCRCAITVSLIDEVLRQLKGIREWFQRQRIFYFYASSLLITYDYVQLQKAKAKLKDHINGAMYNNIISDVNSVVAGHDDADNDDTTIITDQSKTMPTSDTVPTSHWVKVRMIDFAHVFPAEADQHDSNYLFGLDSLIAVIEDLLYG